MLAAERWPRDGPPANPRGWLITTARNRAIDRWRRERSFADKTSTLARSETVDYDATEATAVPDERLELIFTCCHPALAMEAQVALTLRTLGGLTTEEIAHAFLVAPDTMKRRLSRAKAKIRAAGIPFSVPSGERLHGRLGAALAVIYLIFNEGYSGRLDVAAEAIRLGRVLCGLMPKEPEAQGLLAMMLLHHARRHARFSEEELVRLGDQDRSLWDAAQIEEGRATLAAGLARRGRGPYVIQAAIASLQIAESIDWSQIAELYAELGRQARSPVVELSRAVAIAEAGAPAEALDLVESLELDDYHYLHSTRAELLRRLDRAAEARSAYVRALQTAPSEPVRRFLTRRLAELSGSPSDVAQ